MKFFEIFKSGNYPQGAFTEADINSLVENYDPSFCEAPLTLDHMQSGPAYGWVSVLKNDAGKLKASFRDVTDDLKEYVQAGKYKKISVEIYRELENRKPYLKAVSFLGATIPQVKGMGQIQFKEAPSETYTFERSDTATPNKEDDSEIVKLQGKIDDLKTQINSFSEQGKNSSNDENKQKLDELKQTVDELAEKADQFKQSEQDKQKAEEELKTLKFQMRKNEFESFLDEYVNKGNLTQAQKEQSLKIFAPLDAITCFGEENTSIDGLKELIKSLPKQVIFEEIATKDKQDKTEPETLEFTDASEESLQIYNEAKALSEKENISFRDALLKVYK